MKPKTVSKKYEEGFVALVSALLISAVLLILSGTLSLSGYYGRYDILETELKKRSSDIAEACADVAILKVTNDLSYNPVDEINTIDDTSCTIKSITTSGNQKTIYVQDNYKNYYTNLKIVLNTDTFSVISWQEIESL